MPPAVIAQRLGRLRHKNAERANELRAIFGEAGCAADQIQEQLVKRKDPPNVVCTLLGTTDSVIIVAAHSDHNAKGSGAIDDWSGASLLPSLYQSLKVRSRRHTFRFVGFTDEEEGLVGSFFYVKNSPQKELGAVKTVVNLECLGLGPTEVWDDVADKQLITDAVDVAKSMNISLTGMNVENVGNDDTQPFRDRKIPVITFHSVTQKTWPLLHSSKDTLAAVHLDSLYESYRFVLEYLAYIDQVQN
jgi:Zn-dependent M28 family amino/carboxypeptidase